MRLVLKPSGLQKVNAWEYLVRFIFGGAVTVSTGVIAHHYGPSIAGLFLAFPAILPASLTLVKQHDGRRGAIEDGRGARLGAVALVAFAIVAHTLAPTLSALTTLAAATGGWGVVAVLLWILCYSRDRTPV